MPEWFVNAGDKGDCVWFPVFGMDQLVVDATPIKGLVADQPGDQG